MNEFVARLEDGRAVAAEHPSLAVVPFVSAFLAVSEIVRVIGFRGTHVGITFPFPTAITDVWTFVSVPNTPGLGASGALTLGLIVLLLDGVLAAGYLGSIEEAIETGRYDFGANVTQYFAPMLGYMAFVFLFGTGSILFALLGGPDGLAALIFPLFVLFLVVTYLFYAAPYLIVLRDTGVVEALRESYGHAIEGGPYLAFGIGYLLAGAVLSVIGTMITVNLGAFGILIGAGLAAPVGLVFNAAAMSFVRDLDRDEAAE